jgi:hypothetical protein
MNILLFFPITAVLHHLVFYPQQCMLNAFGPRYDVATLSAWLRGDLSPYIGFGAAAFAFLAGRRSASIRLWGLALLIATLPLSLWLWDLPIGDRPVCNWGHDNRLVIGTRHFYVLALACWPVVGWALKTRAPRAL